MTAPALVWRSNDVAVAGDTCSLESCDRPAVVMRGPRTPLIRLQWRGYCAEHAVLYGVPRMRRR